MRTFIEVTARYHSYQQGAAGPSRPDGEAPELLLNNRIGGVASSHVTRTPPLPLDQFVSKSSRTSSEWGVVCQCRRTE